MLVASIARQYRVLDLGRYSAPLWGYAVGFMERRYRAVLRLRFRCLISPRLCRLSDIEPLGHEYRPRVGADAVGNCRSIALAAIASARSV